MIYLLLALVVLLAVSKIIVYCRSKNMTKDKLISKCKKLIDGGRVSAVRSTLIRYPKLLLLHFNELQTTLTEYAQSVEDTKNKNGG